MCKIYRAPLIILNKNMSMLAVQLLIYLLTTGFVQFSVFKNIFKIIFVCAQK